MRLNCLRLPVSCVILICGLAPTRAAEPTFTSEQITFYEKEVQPLLKANCLKCHGDEPKKIKGGLDLRSRVLALKGGDSGTPFDLKTPEKSLFLQAVNYTHKEDFYHMPPSGKLPDKDRAVLTKWVQLGLPWTPGAGPDITHVEADGPKKDWWAWQPVQQRDVPTVKNTAWVKSPIDAFILARLEAKGLKPVAPAGKVALCRRAYYDLIGLPPTPEQIDAFVSDTSPNAFENLIDHLLASPHYGEKWGRHWLDIVRFAESNGYERDGPKPYAYRYRDYVIRSFNDDKPYDQFLKEQLAGDELNREDADHIIATGFYRLGLWDDEPADPPLAYYDGMDDIVTVVSQGMLGMTMNCCRCHDHKGDYLPQTDYYRMLAFFRDLRPYSSTRDVRSPNNLTDITPKAEREKYEAELKVREARIAKLTREMIAMEDQVIKTLSAQEQRAAEGEGRRQVVKKVPGLLSEDLRKKYNQLRRERDQLARRPSPVQTLALSVNNCIVEPPITHVLIRGNPGADGKEVVPGFPVVLGGNDAVVPRPSKDARSSGRRTALANWIASPTNPMTARVMANRLWQYHFNKGIVPTSNDFGKFGEPPSHPALLDWLADDFVQHGWKIKRMHKLLMMTSVYQLASSFDEKNREIDPANTLRWRFDMRRLTAEEVRDSILQASGKLNLKMYGPSVYPKLSAEVLAGLSFPNKKEHWPGSPEHEANRRSVYVFVKRALQVPILIQHDQADTDSTCPVRYTTTVPTQALGMLNGDFTNEQADALAKRLEKEAPGDVAKQVARGLRLITGRIPTPEEVSQDVAFIAAMKSKYKLDDHTALTRYALLLLNINEFVYLD